MKLSILAMTLYFSIVDILEFINIRSPGRFKIEQTSFENYIIHYIPDAIQKRRKTKGLIVSKAQSALVIKEQSGEFPAWALQEQRDYGRDLGNRGHTEISTHTTEKRRSRVSRQMNR